MNELYKGMLMSVPDVQKTCVAEARTGGYFRVLIAKANGRTEIPLKSD